MTVATTKTTKAKQITPVGDRILVQIAEAEKETPGGIVLPDPKRPDQGLVVAVGPGRYLDSGEFVAPTVKEGDKIVFERFAGTDVEIDGEKYVAMNESGVIAIIR